MRWRLPKADRGVRAGPAPAGSAPTPGRQLQKSPGLATLLARLDPELRYDVLDLGRAVGRNVEFLTPWARRLQFVELVDTLRTEAPVRALLEDDPVCAFAAALATSERFDLVLAWDVLDYLERERWQAFSTALSRVCGGGAALLAFLSTAREIPSVPAVYRLEDREHLSREVTGDATRRGPGPRAADLEQGLRDFQVEKAFQLRHGAQEFLLIRKSE
jgi:hypothetical protein